MVSYFVPRGRFLIKAGNLRQMHQKHQQVRWPLLRHFRQSSASKSTNGQTISQSQSQSQRETKVNNVIHAKRVCKTTYTSHAQYSQELQEHRRSTWLKWTGLLLRWAPIGIFFFGAIEWQLHKHRCLREQRPRTASGFQTKVYCLLPLRLLSRCWGWLASCYVPTTLRPYIYGWYSNIFNVNLDEALYPDYKHYNSLSEFFTRPLREGVRSIDAHAPLVSPADGKILHFGTASKALIEQVKGVNYSIQDFLGPSNWVGDAAETENYADAIKHQRDGSTSLYQCVIYLAPGNYHRFHSPAEWQPSLRRHFSGKLLSVSPKVATWLPGLFCLNERVLYLGKWKYGFFSYTAVGATNVGSVQIFMDEQLKTNRWVGLKKQLVYDELLLTEETKLKKGDLVGQFNMGSTIVLLFEAPLNFEFNIMVGQNIRVGEPLGFIVAK